MGSAASATYQMLYRDGLIVDRSGDQEEIAGGGAQNMRQQQAGSVLAQKREEGGGCKCCNGPLRDLDPNARGEGGAPNGTLADGAKESRIRSSAGTSGLGEPNDAGATKEAAGEHGAGGEAPEAKNSDGEGGATKREGGADNPTIYWHEMRGYPPWPCQELPYEEGLKVIKQAPPKCAQVGARPKAVQYFGTAEYAWVHPNQLKKLRPLAAFQRESMEKRHKRETYQRSIREAYALNEDGTVRPIGWWNGPPVPIVEKKRKKSESAEAEAKRRLKAKGTPKKERGAPGFPKRTLACNWPQNLWVPQPAKGFQLPELLEIRAKPRYDAIRRNIYMGAENGSWARPKRLPKEDILVCSCSPESGCGEDCINRDMFVRCCSQFCPCGKECKNKEFQLMKTLKLRAYLTEKCGWAVRTKELIRKGDFIIEYVGEIVTDAECERRMWDAKKKHEKNFYMMELTSDKVIDARDKANLSRLINSSCDPNAKAQKCVDASTGEVRVGIFAIRDIQPGEEITYNYHFLHFGQNSAETASFECRCGAPNCIGRLDSQSEQREKVAKMMGRKIKIKWKDGKYYDARITDFNRSTKQYSVTYLEDGQIENCKLEPGGKVKYKMVKE